MPILVDDVRPGDLVTAQFANDLIATLRELDARIETLEKQGATDAVRIDSSSPAADVGVPMGLPLTLFGNGFLFPPRRNTVTIDNRIVPDEAFIPLESSSTAITFTVPTDLEDVSGSGRVMAIRVQNESGAAIWNCRVLPEEETSNPPQIESVFSDAGNQVLVVGEQATITGTNLHANPRVTLRVGAVENGIAVILSESATELQIAVPDMDVVPEDDPGGINMTLQVATDNPPPNSVGVTVSRFG